MIDRVAAGLGRDVSSRCRSASSGSSTGCSTARSASAARRAPARSFLRRDGASWTTDKDGIILDLLAAEITATTGKDPGEQLRRARATSSARRSTRASTRRPRPRRRPRSRSSSPEHVTAADARRRADHAQLTRAPGNGAPIGGLKVVHRRAAGSPRARRAPRTSTRSTRRASKIEAHLDAILDEAQAIVSARSRRRACSSSRLIAANSSVCPSLPCAQPTSSRRWCGHRPSAAPDKGGGPYRHAPARSAPDR